MTVAERLKKKNKSFLDDENDEVEVQDNSKDDKKKSVAERIQNNASRVSNWNEYFASTEANELAYQKARSKANAFNNLDTAGKIAYYRDENQKKSDNLSNDTGWSGFWKAVTSKDYNLQDWKDNNKRKEEYDTNVAYWNGMQSQLDNANKQTEVSGMTDQQINSKIEELTAIANDKTKSKAERTQANNELDMYKTEKYSRVTASLDKDTLDIIDNYNNAETSTKVVGLLGFLMGGSNANGTTTAHHVENDKKRAEAIAQLEKLGVTDIEELAKYRGKAVNKDMTEKTVAEVEEYGKAHPVASAVASAALSIPATVSSITGQFTTNANDYDPNNMLNALSNIKGALDNGVISSDAFAGDGILSRNTKAKIYSLGQSMVDSVVAGVIPGGSVLLGLGAFSQTYNDNIRSGKDATSAFLSATMAGIAEGFFESFSIGNLKAFGEVEAKTIKDYALNFIKSIGINASEEANTEAANILTDYLINGGLSDYSQAVNNYIAQGMTEDEAKRKAGLDCAAQVGEAALGGAIMGGAFGAGGTAFQATNTAINNTITGSYISQVEGGVDSVLSGAEQIKGNKTANRYYNAVDTAQQRVEQAKQTANEITSQELSEENTEAPTVATNSKDGKYTLSEKRKIGWLSGVVEDSYKSDVERIAKDTIKERLTELGETGNTDKIAEAIYITLRTGESEGTDFSRFKSNKIVNIIRNSETGQQVLREALLGGTAIGDDASWTANIETRLAELNKNYNTRNAKTETKTEDNLEDQYGTEETKEQRTPILKALEKVRDTNKTIPDGSLSIGSEIAQELAAENDGIIDEEAFAKDFEYFYFAGNKGSSFEDTNSYLATSGLSEEQKQKIYNLGKNEEQFAKEFKIKDKQVELTGKTKVEPTKLANGDVVNTTFYETEFGDWTTLKEASSAGVSRDDVELYGSAPKLKDKELADIAIGIYKSSKDNYVPEIRKIAQYGSLGLSYDEAMDIAEFKKIVNTLGEKNAKKVFERGQKLGETEERKSSTKTSKGGNVKVELEEGTKEIDKDYIEGLTALYSAIAKKLDINMVLTDINKNNKLFKGSNAYFDLKNTIVVNIDASNTVGVVPHELVHYLREYNEEGYKALLQAVQDWQNRTNPDGYRNNLLRLMDIYGEYGTDIVDEEFVANTISGLLSDEKSMDQFLKWINLESDYSKSFREKVLSALKEAFDKIVNTIKAILKNEGFINGVSEEAYQMAKADFETAEKMRKLFYDGLDAISGTTGSYEAQLQEEEQNGFDEVGEETDLPFSLDDKITAESGDIRFSIKIKDVIEEKSRKYFEAHRDQATNVSEEMFKAANDIINRMADYMTPFLDTTNNKGLRYLPMEILGKTVFSNGSYNKSVENTTDCFRTLAYIDFTNEIKKEIGRPLTAEESFLASQMMYEIAKEPQCLYCYVALDRKAYDEFLLKYIQQRDKVIDKYNKLKNKSKSEINKLYKEYLDGRKDTPNMKNRFNLWIKTVDNGTKLISLTDLTTEDVRSQIANESSALKEQIIDAEKYAQSASWAKKHEQYRSYNSDILRMSKAMVNKLNKHYGLRFYSFSEYTAAFIVENMQQIRDASLKGLYGLAYTKKTDFARIFASTGMNINISTFGKIVDGKVVEDVKQGASWAEVQELRKQYPNVGAVFVATNDELVEWALAQDWIDVVIPFHIVRTGANIAEFYHWINNTAFQSDKDEDGKNKTVTPAEHHNDFETFMQLCKERGLTPRFEKWLNNPNYMKLVNETRRSDLGSVKLTPNFNIDEAIKSFDQFVEDGGYYDGYYEEGVDVDKAVKIVSNDILSGKKANEVTYGRQDKYIPVNRRNVPRVHGQSLMHSLNDSEYIKLAEEPEKNRDELQSAVETKAEEWGAYKGEDGKVKVFYHGTNGKFTVFEDRFLGSGSGDLGWFGRGHYFAFTEGEASYYGRNVVPAYLKLVNPFNHDKEYFNYNGKKYIGAAQNALFIVNFTNKFPNLVKDKVVSVIKEGESQYKDISFKEFVDEYMEIVNNKKFKVFERNGEYSVKADKVNETYIGSDGKEHRTFWYDFEYTTISEDIAKDQLYNAYEYLRSNVYRNIDLPSPANIIMETESYTDELKKLGYDGVIQSEYGDEAITFDSSQVKSADPVTYDDEGKVIPLSERFNQEEKDIRYSLDEQQEPYVLSPNNELSKRIGNKNGNEKYKVISEYILEILDGKEIVFPDGRKVFVNKSDANHISSKADSKKISEISRLKELINRAYLIKDDTEFKHKKFTHFAYYETSVKYDNDIFYLVFNIGKSKNDKRYHLYEINHPKIRNTGNDRIVLGDSAIKRTSVALDTSVSKDNITLENKEVNNFDENTDSYIANETEIKYSLVEDKDTVDFLDNQKGLKVFRAMQYIDGELYPPMAAKIKNDDTGKFELVESIPFDKWSQADEHPEKAVRNKKTGKLEFILNKGNGSSIKAAYNPYIHTSLSPLNDQFSSAYKRPNIVIVEGYVPESELTSGYMADGAKDAVGMMSWHSGPVSSKLKGEKSRKVILSRYFKPLRVVPNSEVANHVAKLLEGENISVPYEVVTPGLREELSNLGVDIIPPSKKESIAYSNENDIKFSQEEKTEEALQIEKLKGENKSLIKQNKQLADQLRNAEYVIRNANFDFQVDLSKVDKVAKQIAKSYGSKVDAKTVSDKLAEAYNLIANGKNRSKADKMIEEVADMILDGREVKQEISDENKAILREIKSVSITLSEEQKKEVANEYDSYNGYRRAMMGSLNISNSGTPLDIRYSELSHMYPYLLPADASDVDQPIYLANAIQTLRDSNVEDQYDKETLKEFLVLDIQQSYMDTAKAGTISSKNAQAMKKIREDTQKQLKAIRDSYEKRINHAVSIAKTEISRMLQIGELEYKLGAARDALEIQKKMTEAEKQKVIMARANIMAKVQERNKKRKDTESKRVRRVRIAKKVNRLNRMLLSPSASVGSVKEELQEGVMALVDIFTNTNSVFDYKKIDTIKRVYDNISSSRSDNYISGFSEELNERIKEMGKMMGDKRLSEFNENDLKLIEDLVDNVTKIVKGANEVFFGDKNAKLSSIGSKELTRLSKLNPKKFDPKGVMKGISVNNLTPAYFFRKVGGSLEDSYKAIRDGQSKYAKNISLAQRNFKEIYDTYGGKNGEKLRGYEKFTIDTTWGEKLTFTNEQAMLIYATWKREQISDQESRHLTEGGIVYEEDFDAKKKEIKDNRTHLLAVNDLLNICNHLDKNQKEYVDKMVAFLSRDMAELGNEVSLQLYGYRGYTERYYIPYNVSEHYLFTEFASSGDARLKSMGFTKPLTHGANKPIILSDFTKVWADHCERMSAYNAFVIPLEDFTKLWNYQGMANGKMVSLKSEFQTAFGNSYSGYVDNLMRDLNGNVVKDSRETVVNSMIRMFKKNAVMLSLSVAIQQPSAIARSFAYINPKYFVLTTFRNAKKSFEEAKKYASSALMKHIGGFDIGTARGITDWITDGREVDESKFRKLERKTDKAGGFLPEIMDALAWGHIWEAVKKEVKATTGLTGEALLEAAGKRFDEVVDLTQVYDSTFTRSGNMRSKGPGMNMLTSFMAEPTVTINMLMDAYDQSRKGNKKFAVGAIAAVGTSLIFNALLKSIVTALRHRDDDDSYLETYVGDVIGNLMDDSNPLGLIPILRDIFSMLKGYDVELTTISSLSELRDMVINLFNNAQNMESAWDVTKEVGNAISTIAYAMGVPLKNLNRDVWAIINNIGKDETTTMSDIINAIQENAFPFTKKIGESLGIYKEKTKSERLYEAWLDYGYNSPEYEKIASQYSSATERRKQITSNIKKDYLDGTINYNEAYNLLVKAEWDDPAKKIEEWNNPSSSEDKEDKWEGKF